MNYDDNNIFAKILRKELPAEVIYEDAKTLAIMDIMPRVDGHILVIPKSPCRNILDASHDHLGACMMSVKKLANAAMEAFKADGVTVQQFSEVAGGQEVFHLHFHILPRKIGISIRPHESKFENTEILKLNAQKVKDILGKL